MANPDITQAVGLVAQRFVRNLFDRIVFGVLCINDPNERTSGVCEFFVHYREKEKSEMKDRKVLEILNAKDDKIDELQKLVGSQSKELSEAILVYVRRRKTLWRFLAHSLIVCLL